MPGLIGLISSHMHPDTWRFFAYILVLQPVRIPLYIMVFFTGAWAWRQKWFAAGGYVPGPGKWGTAFLLGFFHMYFNHAGRWLAALGGTSYGVYYLHMPVLFPVVWAFVGVDMNVYLKYICVCILTLGICYLGSRYGLSHIKSFALSKK